MNSEKSGTQLNEEYFTVSRRVALATVALTGDRNQSLLGGVVNFAARVSGVSPQGAQIEILSMAGHKDSRHPYPLIFQNDLSLALNPDNPQALAVADAETIPLADGREIERSILMDVVEKQIAAEQAMRTLRERA